MLKKTLVSNFEGERDYFLEVPLQFKDLPDCKETYVYNDRLIHENNTCNRCRYRIMDCLQQT